MHLRHVSLPVADPAASAEWYAAVLDQRVAQRGHTWQITVGTSVLSLRQEVIPGAHHLAFDISPALFTASKRWLVARVPLLIRDGQDEFEGPLGWNSRSLYFEGLEGSVLELIARRDLQVSAAEPVVTAETGVGPPLLGLSEVGIAVPDVRGTARRLRVELGVPAYAGEPEDTFAAVGDVNGLLILVSEGRRWFPTGDRIARAARIDVDGAGWPGTSTVGSGRLTLS